MGLEQASQKSECGAPDGDKECSSWGSGPGSSGPFHTPSVEGEAGEKQKAD